MFGKIVGDKVTNLFSKESEDITKVMQPIKPSATIAKVVELLKPLHISYDSAELQRF